MKTGVKELDAVLEGAFFGLGIYALERALEIQKIVKPDFFSNWKMEQDLYGE